MDNQTYDGQLTNAVETIPVQFTFISHLIQGAYLIHIYRQTAEFNFYVIYKTKPGNTYEVVCNRGSLICADGENYTLTAELSFIGIQETPTFFLDKFPPFIPLNSSQIPKYLKDYEEQSIKLERKYSRFQFDDYLYSYYNSLISNSKGTHLDEEMLNYIMKPSTIEEQIEYLLDVSPRLQKALALYSHNGDVLLNMYLRNNRTVTEKIQTYFENHIDSFDEYQRIPTIDAVNIQGLLENLDADLKDLFYNVPPLKQDLKVYRGITKIDHFNGTALNLYKNSGYLSTTFELYTAMGFSKDRYMNVIYLKKGSKVLYNVFSEYISELEIILPDNSYFLITKEFQPESYRKNVNILTNESIFLAE